MKKPVVLFSFLICLCLIISPSLAQDEASNLLNRINNLRASLGLPGYSMNGALNAAAQQQAQWIVATGNVSHNHEDGTGPRDRAVANGYPSSDVSENIYGGTMANADFAWTFWVNSPIHYRGMTHEHYLDLGIGIASGEWGTAYVLVFGNPGVPDPVVNSGGGGGSTTADNSDPAAAAPPPYLLGKDEFGNIMHEIQPEDTLGGIALIYGRTWDDIPAIVEYNQLESVTDLEIGAVLLIPPLEGTFTPTPEGGNTEATAESTSAVDVEVPPTTTPTEVPAAVIEPTQGPLHVATAGAAPPELFGDISPTPYESPTPAESAVALMVTFPPNTPTSEPTAVTIQRSGTSPWLIGAILLQCGILTAAGFEFFRRARKGKSRR